MRILRVTYFAWGDTVNNWYPDREAVERQLLTEVDRKKSKDVVHEEWFACEPIKVAKPETRIPSSPINKVEL